MKVMIAVDGTEASQLAVSAAADLFGDDAQYIVVSVGAIVPVTSLSPFGFTPMMMLLASPQPPDPAERARRRASDAAGALADEVDDVHHVATSGPPGPTICRLAEEYDCDVIVIGSADRGWLDKLVGPEVGRHVVDNAPCHVVVARDGS